MTQLDQHIKEAFADLRAPEPVKADALAAIERRRAGEAASPAPQPEGAPAAKRRAQRRWRVVVPLAAAAALALAFVGVGGVQMAQDAEGPQQPVPVAAPVAEAAAHVGIDVNPSLELAVSAEGQVIQADSLNDDAGALLAQVSLAGLPYEQALDQLFASQAFAPYRSADMLVEVDVASDDDALAAQLQSQTEAALAALPCETACVRADEAQRQAAAEAGMGMGRYRAACELVALDPSVSLQDCAHLTMAELRDRISACHGSQAAGTDAQQGGGQGGQGQGQGYQGGPGAGQGHHGGHAAGHGQHGKNL